jgi:DinB superfamily
MVLERGPDHVASLVGELESARAEFLAALNDVEPDLLLAPGLVGTWSARELVAHIGYWTGHAAEALHAAEQGRLAEFGEDEMDVDERNEVVARVAGETDLGTVRKREESAFEAMLTRLKRVDPAVLDDKVSYCDTLERVIADDGWEHYREHALDLRAWFSDNEGGDEEDG